ncbi:hypothetical protein OPV22_031368 [Ensete ventricosum]|uniref:Uncharacterized protein n=1 Tax=Ensete ventricosum TaxID=4639 RepID=A0AAV8PTD0_ENSVE|nr:hypothetical protein OPV22_031368 [Ensete ventricosum]
MSTDRGGGVSNSLTLQELPEPHRAFDTRKPRGKGDSRGNNTGAHKGDGEVRRPGRRGYISEGGFRRHLFQNFRDPRVADSPRLFSSLSLILPCLRVVLPARKNLGGKPERNRPAEGPSPKGSGESEGRRPDPRAAPREGCKSIPREGSSWWRHHGL